LIEQAMLKKYDDYVRFPGSHKNSWEKWSAGGGGEKLIFHLTWEVPI
jgi:hypothetical protein